MGRGAGCLSSVGTYPQCIVGQGCRLFKRCLNLSPGQVRGVELDTVLLLFQTDKVNPGQMQLHLFSSASFFLLREIY